MTGVLDTLLAASPSRKSVTICVDGALQAEWDQTLDELDTIQIRGDQGSLASPEVNGVVDRLDVLRERVKASEVTFLLETIDWTERIALMAQHPPRDGNLPDQLRGVNTATYYAALIRASCVSVTGVDGDAKRGDNSGDGDPEIPDDVWVRLLGRPGDGDRPAIKGSLNAGQVNRLVAAATKVNEAETTVPPSARSLLESRDSGASLAQPSPGTSPRSGSEGGNPPGSPKSSTTRKKARSKAASAAS